ncbi:MAG: glutaminyl-peptide cyclotransferase [Bryobacteraceae bacterium]
MRLGVSKTAGTALLFAILSVIRAAQVPSSGTPVYKYRIVNTYPHDPNAFTQGLVYLNGAFYESTGLYGHSTLRMVDVTTGQVMRQQSVPSQFFAEGLTAWKSNLVQLTWKAGDAFEYDLFSFQHVRDFHYSGEGWGLAQDGRELIMSDGSADLRMLDPASFREISRLHVTDSGAPVNELNELEYVRGEVYANVWQTNRIARISPKTGKVVGWIDCTGLLADSDRTGHEDVLNGIAYDKEHDRLFVTGKLWPKLFEIKVTR